MKRFALTKELNMLMKKTPNMEFVAAFTLNGILKSGSGVYTNSAEDDIYYH
jgi:hypothetical protein